MEVSIDTAHYTCGDPEEAWQQILTEYLVPFHSLRAPDIPFRGQLRCSHLDPVDVVVNSRTAGVKHRTRRLISQASEMRTLLSLHLAGDWVVSADRSQQWLRPGDLVLWDMTRPMTLAYPTSMSVLSLRVPPEVLPRTERLLTSAATVLPTGCGLGALIAPYLRGLVEQAADLRPATATRVGAATVDLLATYFADLLGEASPIDGAPERTLLRQIKAQIEARLGEPELCPAAIAAAHHISVRLLYKLFAADGHTVAGWVRERRLERARQDLTHPAHAGSSITTIAFRCGFVDSAHFSRVFKAAYDVSPRDYRQLHAADLLSASCARSDNKRARTAKNR